MKKLSAIAKDIHRASVNTPGEVPRGRVAAKARKEYETKKDSLKFDLKKKNISKGDYDSILNDLWVDYLNVVNSEVYAREGLKTDLQKAINAKGVQDALEQLQKDFLAGRSTLLSRVNETPAPGEGLTKAEADKFLSPLIRKRRLHKLNIEVVESHNDLPADVREEIGPKSHGAYVGRQDTIYLVADTHEDLAQLEETLLHEAMGHAGFARKFQKSYYGSINTLFRHMGGYSGIVRIADKLGALDARFAKYAARKDAILREGGVNAERDAQSLMVEEILAIAQEKQAGLSLPTKFKNWVKAHYARMRRFFNSMGIGAANKFDGAELQLLLSEMQFAAQNVDLKPRKATPTYKSVVSEVDALMDTVGRDVDESTPESRAEDTKEATDQVKEESTPSKKRRAAAYTTWADRMATRIFSSDAALSNAIRRSIIAWGKDNSEIVGRMLAISTSQAVHGGAVASQVVLHGGAHYDDSIYKWVVTKEKENLPSIIEKIHTIADSYEGITPEKAELYAHTYFEARRLRGLQQRRDDYLKKAEEALARGDKKTADKFNTLATDKHIHMTDEQIAAGMKIVEKLPELAEAEADWEVMRGRIVGIMQESGLYNAEQAEDLLEKFGYVPFYREEQLADFKGPSQYIQGLQVQMDKKFKGGKNKVNNIFDNIERWIAAEVNRAVRNKSARSLITQALEFELAEPTDTAVRGETARVFVDGELKHFKMADPLFVEAFTGLENIAIPLNKYMLGATSALRQSVVLYPLFSIGQLTQDSYGAMFTSGLPWHKAMKIPLETLKQMVKTVRRTSKTHKELSALGVVGTADWSATVGREDVEIAAGLMKPRSGWRNIKSKLEHFSMAADNSVRQAVYKIARESGVSKAEAIEKAFELINFRKKGSSAGVQWANHMIPFFGAYLQASHVALKTVTGTGITPVEREAALKTLAATTAMTMTLSFILAALNADDDSYDYEGEDPITRDRRLIITGTGGLGVPLRKDVFSIPKIIMEHAYLLYTGKAAEDPAKMRESIKEALINSVVGPTAVPQIGKPLMELWADKSSFTGRSIVGRYQKGMAPHMQYSPHTSELGKGIGELSKELATALGVSSEWEASPAKFDHFLRGYFGSAGGLTLWLTNQVMKSDAVANKLEAPARAGDISWGDWVNTIPGMGPFTSKRYGSALKSDFYDISKKTREFTATLARKKQISGEDAVEYLQEHEAEARVAKPAKRFKEKLTRLRTLMRNITDDKLMPSVEKGQRLDRLKAQERRMLQSNKKFIAQLREIGEL